MARFRGLMQRFDFSTSLIDLFTKEVYQEDFFTKEVYVFDIQHMETMNFKFTGMHLYLNLNDVLPGINRLCSHTSFVVLEH